MHILASNRLPNPTLSQLAPQVVRYLCKPQQQQHQQQLLQGARQPQQVHQHTQHQQSQPVYWYGGPQQVPTQYSNWGLHRQQQLVQQAQQHYPQQLFQVQQQPHQQYAPQQVHQHTQHQQPQPVYWYGGPQQVPTQYSNWGLHRQQQLVQQAQQQVPVLQAERVNLSRAGAPVVQCIQPVHQPAPMQQYVAPMPQQVYQYTQHQQTQPVYGYGGPQQVPTQYPNWGLLHRQQQLVQPAPQKPTCGAGSLTPIEVKSTATKPVSSASTPESKPDQIRSEQASTEALLQQVQALRNEIYEKWNIKPATNKQELPKSITPTPDTSATSPTHIKVPSTTATPAKIRHEQASTEALRQQVQALRQNVYSRIHNLQASQNTTSTRGAGSLTRTEVESTTTIGSHHSAVSQSDENLIHEVLINLMDFLIDKSKLSTLLLNLSPDKVNDIHNLRLSIAKNIHDFLDQYETLKKTSAGENVSMIAILKTQSNFLINLKKLVGLLSADHPKLAMIEVLMSLLEEQSPDDSVLSAASNPESSPVSAASNPESSPVSEASNPESSPVKPQPSEIDTLVSDLSKEFEQAFLVEAAKMKSYVEKHISKLTTQITDINNLKVRTHENHAKQNKILLDIHNDLKFCKAVLDSINHLTKNQKLNLNFDPQTTKAIQLISKLSCAEFLKKLLEKHCPTISEFFKIYNKIQPLTNIKPNTISSTI